MYMYIEIYVYICIHVYIAYLHLLTFVSIDSIVLLLDQIRPTRFAAGGSFINVSHFGEILHEIISSGLETLRCIRALTARPAPRLG